MKELETAEVELVLAEVILYVKLFSIADMHQARIPVLIYFHTYLEAMRAVFGFTPV